MQPLRFKRPQVFPTRNDPVFQTNAFIWLQARARLKRVSKPREEMLSIRLEPLTSGSGTIAKIAAVA